MLLRLQSNSESTAEWTNTFNENVMIPANSKIALMSLSALPTNADSYLVGDGNSMIGVKYGGTGDVVFGAIQYGSYTKTQLASVLTQTLTQLKTFSSDTTFNVSFTGELLNITFNATGSSGIRMAGLQA